MPAPGAPIVFDCDGLLLETEEGWTEAETELFRRYGAVYGPEEKRRVIGTSLPEASRVFEELLDQPGRSGELLEEVIDLAAEVFSRGVEPMPGATALVDELRGTRPMAVASNSYRRLIDIALERAGMADVFDVVIAGDEIEHAKPAPDLYLDACRRLGVDPKDAIALEDSPNGVEAAKAAGMFVIGVPYLPDLSLDDADVVAPSLDHEDVRNALGLAATTGS